MNDALDADALSAIENLSQAVTPTANILLTILIVITGLRIAQGKADLTQQAVRVFVTATITSYCLTNWGTLANTLISSATILATKAVPTATFDFTKPTAAAQLFVDIYVAYVKSIGTQEISLWRISMQTLLSISFFLISSFLFCVLALLAGVYQMYLLIGTKIMCIYAIALLPWGLLPATSQATGRAIEILLAEAIRVFMFVLVITLVNKDLVTLAERFSSGTWTDSVSAVIGALLLPIAGIALILFLPNQAIRHVHGLIKMD
jgi:type IV secretory pathway TrbL component